MTWLFPWLRTRRKQEMVAREVLGAIEKLGPYASFENVMEEINRDRYLFPITAGEISEALDRLKLRGQVRVSKKWLVDKCPVFEKIDWQEELAQ